MVETFFKDISHPGLGRSRRVTAPNQLVLEEKIRLQRIRWDQQFQRVHDARDQYRERAKQYAIDQREQARQDRLDQKELAAERTNEAQAAIQALKETLARTLSVDDRIDWEALKDRTRFSKPKPQPPAPLPHPTEPMQDESRFQPELSFLDKVSPSRRASKEQAARAAFLASHSAWKTEATKITQQNTEAQRAFDATTAAWGKEREVFAAAKKAQHEQMDTRCKAYEAGDPDAILDYCELVLSNSEYPEWITPDFEMEYNQQTKTLIVEYELPPFDALPRLKEVKYVQSKNELVEVSIPESTATKLYDSLVYQITLRSIHELFEADMLDALDAIAFNGWVKSVDKGTGQEVQSCVLSLHTSKAEFLTVNLAQVDPKTCFKALKGVGSSKLRSLTPIAPILQMDRTDKRFVDARSVEGTIDTSTNLAAIDWEDFEHLIRELFEKEFTASGGEVKITQASKDGGVDAVAFDPDPIRGGKIVIQAKRYTNTVGVSAVRDLFGTVLNESATKGILVTTSDYAPDAYSFAKGKPLTLLNGANLLHLLEKHGHRARIDLQEAKKVGRE